jgi:hypothetical protein
VFSRASTRYHRVVTSFFDQLGSELVEYVELKPGWQARLAFQVDSWQQAVEPATSTSWQRPSASWWPPQGPS